VIQALLNHADLGTTAVYTVDAQTGAAIQRLPSSWENEEKDHVSDREGLD